MADWPSLQVSCHGQGEASDVKYGFSNGVVKSFKRFTEKSVWSSFDVCRVPSDHSGALQSEKS